MAPPTSESYDAFGLAIDSDVPLPAVAAVSSQSNRRRSDATDGAVLVVRRASLPASPGALADDATLVHEEPGSLRLYRASGDYYWFYDGVGSLCVRDGRSIDVDVDESVGDATAQHLVLGAGVYSALVQRGRPVLHASAVVVDGVAVAFAGETGRGKSTLAAACYAAGHDVLADDVTAIEIEDDVARVTPAYPQLRVDPTVADELGLQVDGPGAAAGERSVDVADGFATQPTELAAVYLLESGAGPPQSEPVDARRGLFELLRTAYVLSPDDDAAALAGHQRACADVASRVDVRRLVRPDALDLVGALVDVVEADVAARE